MTVSPLVWGVTIAVILALLAFDYFFHIRKAHIPTLKEAAIWSSIYVGLAVVFGGVVWALGGTQMGTEYFAGYITEKALSVDNLFVFLIIMASFRVPREDQQKVLLFGIVFSLIARTAFILLGAALINSFSWVFYLFGLILLITAGNLLKPESTEGDDEANNFIIRLARKIFHTSETYDGDKLFTMENGKRVLTPMLLVMVAIGGTDILFALDSIPAIFGLTQNVFIVFTATAFSLMGLRQLYFLIDGLLDRLIYLSYGLATILAFIGVKLVLHALHENTLPFINGGEHVPVIEITTGLSLSVIVGVLLVTVVASLVSPAGKAMTAVNNARRHADSYLDLSYTADPAERERVYKALCDEEQDILKMDVKYRNKVKDIEEIRETVARAHSEHERYLSR
ncbi:MULTISPECIES: TerC family protein [unclassified Arthrobacter]|uniref:TerC family protein n=1 Tax=unclassified Arthrobacter TaxID=235627 RepID=UPI001D14504F|nr:MULTISPECIES: TerC family protein [unclassified Arthrobacter]MCC3290177.1 TerC family protein [Arthrobacter sp. zg-Y1110]MCC3300312.1 TerC family protein [Arthrobacter sp. zg-Y895]UWX84435.1 TerC family protein [Arthrobacter sp. zg-Y1110]